MASKRKKFRQAVVIIHGIGEQRPMDTVRSLAEAIFSVIPDKKKTTILSHPDKVTDLFDLRRLIIRSSRNRPLTDFYEYYWQHHATGNTLRQTLSWLGQLLFVRPTRRLFVPWLICWLLVIALIVSFITGLLTVNIFQLDFENQNFLISIASFIGLSAISYILQQYLGDAARYFSGSPANVKMRRDILQGGVALMKNLTALGRYDRIIVVGHSLGSVVAYDIIKHLWNEYNNRHKAPENVNQNVLKALEHFINAKLTQESSEEQINLFQEAQHNLWKEYRRMGSPWLVTDFITLGSPLYHAPAFMSSSLKTFIDRKEALEYPSCPPSGEEIYYHTSYKTKSGLHRAIKILHHAAPFAMVRWTNMYMPGDFIGGPLKQLFGAGILDYEVKVNNNRWMGHLPISHVKYWNTIPFSDLSAKLDPKSSTMRLLNALRLRSKESLKQMDCDDASWVKHCEPLIKSLTEPSKDKKETATEEVSG